MADPVANADFGFVEHMDHPAAAQAEAQADAEMYERHRIWLETSWGGWVVTTIRTIADNSFFRAIADALEDQADGKSASAIVLSNAARMMLVLAFILLVLLLGKLSQIIVGKEIVIEQDIIIEHEVRRSEVEEKENEDVGETRWSASDKPQHAGGSYSESTKKDN